MCAESYQMDTDSTQVSKERERDEWREGWTEREITVDYQLEGCL